MLAELMSNHSLLESDQPREKGKRETGLSEYRPYKERGETINGARFVFGVELMSEPCVTNQHVISVGFYHCGVTCMCSGWTNGFQSSFKAKICQYLKRKQLPYMYFSYNHKSDFSHTTRSGKKKTEKASVTEITFGMS